MQKIEEISLIQFQEQNTHYQADDHIFFVYSEGCASSIGRKGGAQELHLNEDCADEHIIIHELLHSLGFFHEHQRPDRDEFITVNMQPIPDRLKIQYEKLPTQLFHSLITLSMRYDSDSIMHYDSLSNEYYKKPIILTKDNQVIKVNKKMSPIDIAKLNLMYPFDGNSSAENNNLKNEYQKLLETKNRLLKNSQNCQADLKSLTENCEMVKTFNPTKGDTPEWSAWSSYSECTVSCGLGIRYRTRVCRPVYSRLLNRIIECEGNTYDYQTCYDRACSTNHDTRMIQCKRHGESIGKKLFSYEVPINSQNKCLLNCKESNGKTLNTGKYVQNGTPCSYDSDDFFCILNECKRVGCDFRIGSTKKYNKCGICGGTESQCEHVKETRNIQGNAPGIMVSTQISIPAGAYNIKIEIQKSSWTKTLPAQICLKNGRYNVISRQVLGTHSVIHDGVNWKLTNRHQMLTAKGPTTSNYQIGLFMRYKGQHVNINVEYYTKQTYQWAGVPWTCVAGKGSAKGSCIKQRNVKCITKSASNNRRRSRKKSQKSGVRVDDKYCDFNKKPSTKEEFKCPTGCPKKYGIFG